MKNRTGAIIGLVIIVAALAFCAFTFKGSLMNLVPFADAKADTDATVQIMGAPVPGTMLYDNDAHALRFALADGQGDTMPIVFKGPKPEDLDSAMSKAAKITAQGTYDPRAQAFLADNLLVKCPSKYQGAPSGTERKYGSS
jgi:cytochrome c-type biogenesis protein CcmE